MGCILFDESRLAREAAGKSTDKLSLFTQGIIPKMPLGLLLDIRPAQPQVMQCCITEAGQLLPLAIQLQPACRALQGRMPQVVQGKGRLLDAADMTFHREALRVGWPQSRAGLKINPTNVSDAMHLGD